MFESGVHSSSIIHPGADVPESCEIGPFSIIDEGAVLGEEVIADKAAIVSVKMKSGNVVMIGFRTQHRVQTHGTFKFLFNALISGPE